MGRARTPTGRDNFRDIVEKEMTTLSDKKESEMEDLIAKIVITNVGILACVAGIMLIYSVWGK